MTRAGLIFPMVALLASAGCAAETSAAPIEVELGTGEWQFEPLQNGQQVNLVFGPQGGYHIWTSFRADALDPTRVTLEVTTQVEGALPEESRVAVDMTQDPNGFRFIGWPSILSCPTCAANRPLLLRVTLTDRVGRTGTDARTIIPMLPEAL